MQRDGWWKYDQWFTIALLVSEFGQDSTLRNMLNTIQLCKPGFTKSHTSLDNIVSLENRIAYDFGKDRLHNCAVA